MDRKNMNLDQQNAYDLKRIADTLERLLKLTEMSL